MKKLAAIGLAGALATASVGATSESAQATTFGGFVAGLFVGGAVVAIAHGWRPFATARAYAYYPSYPTDHVSWCQARYRTYNASTDTFIGNDLRPHRCVVY